MTIESITSYLNEKIESTELDIKLSVNEFRGFITFNFQYLNENGSTLEYSHTTSEDLIDSLKLSVCELIFNLVEDNLISKIKSPN